MFIEFTTVITHRVELGGPDGIRNIEHSVSVEPSADALALGQQIIFAIAVGGCKSAVAAIEGGVKPTVVEVPSDDEY